MVSRSDGWISQILDFASSNDLQLGASSQPPPGEVGLKSNIYLVLRVSMAF